jgi:hypothetical protein
VLKNTERNCWLFSSNGCYRIQQATAMAVKEYSEQLLAVQQ